MKKLFGLLFLLSLSIAVSAQKLQHPTQAMTDVEVSGILKRMQQKTSDTEKVDVLKAGVKDKGIMIAQLTTLLNQFLTDDAKLSCAEFAYASTVDYKKYRELTNIFSNEQSKTDLEDYIRKHK